MGDIKTGVIALTLLTGAVYFWYKARFFNVSWIQIILGYVFFPIAVVVGLYWVAKDLWTFGPWSKD